MPIDITVTTTQGETTLVVWDSLATQSFQLMVNAEPLDLELDKYNWILKTIEEPFVNPQFDQGILLVNGVDFETYGQEIWECYQNRAFSGNFRISFWDSFDTPNSGYPSTLPEPMGHGMVPAEVLGRYSTVIWIGNHYNGDVGKWQQTSILAYLKAGGNILLMTRLGRDFIYGELQEYLGITWAENPECIIWNCAAVYPGLQDNLISAEQSYNAVFETDFSNSESILLFQEPVSFSVPRGLGMWHKPAAGGNYHSEGGNFVFLSGRPYRYDASRLRTNVEYILENFFHEPSGTLPDRMTLYQNYPNPFNGSTTIPFYLERAGQVELTMFNTLGQKVKTLFSGNMATGDHVVSWDGNDEAGNVVASGIYIYHLRSDGSTETRKMVLLK